MPAIDEEGPAERLRQRGLQLRGDGARGLLGAHGALGADAHLDQLVRLEHPGDGRDHPVGDARLAELHQRVEVMAERAQVAALLAGQAPRERLVAGVTLVALPLGVALEVALRLVDVLVTIQRFG